MIIDDEPFTYLEDLRNEQFNIQQIKDIEDFRSVEPYPVVICDIMGVGHKFNATKEGIYVVETIKKMYPTKQIAVYSSGNYKLSTLSNLHGIETIQKDADKDMWCSYMEKLINKASDPILIWKTIRVYLLENDVSVKDVMKLESLFVNIILHHPKDLSTFPQQEKFPNLSHDIRSIIQSIIAGGILHLFGV